MNVRHPDGNGIFQQDNAPCHKSLRVRTMLGNAAVNAMVWPPYSPDLSPIENLWAIVKEELHKDKYASKEWLITRINAIWNDDAAVKNACRTLTEGVQRRIEACIAANGGTIKY